MSPQQLLAFAKALGLKNSQILYLYAKSLQGQNLCGDTPIIDGCATTINNVFAGAFGEPIGGGPSTTLLYKALSQDLRFEVFISNPQIGDIIISPTGMGTNPEIPNGHVGIVSDSGLIMSNNSADGIFDEHLSLILWTQRYQETGGYPIFYFRMV